ncbi:MAG: hypothetical protein KKF42_03690 [Actinobacteria bacterium]|nr:hypothetical protein [Actinomycetota bacterium]
MNSTPYEPMGEPQEPQQAAPAPQQQQQPQPPQPPQPPQTTASETYGTDPHLAAEQPRPRTGPIVWGALFLVFCAYVVQRELAPSSVDTAVWIATTVIGLGVLLLVVGIAVVIRGASSR